MAKILYYGGDKLEHPGIGDVVCIPSYRYDIDRGLGVGHAGYKDRYHATPQHPSGAAAVAAYVATAHAPAVAHGGGQVDAC